MKRWIAFILCAFLIVGLVGSLAFAENQDGSKQVCYLLLALNSSDYHGKTVITTLPVDSVSSKGVVTCKLNLKYKIYADTGDRSLQGSEPKYVTVQGKVDNSSSSEIEITDSIVLYAGKDAPKDYFVELKTV